MRISGYASFVGQETTNRARPLRPFIQMFITWEHATIIKQLNGLEGMEELHLKLESLQKWVLHPAEVESRRNCPASYANTRERRPQGPPPTEVRCTQVVNLHTPSVGYCKCTLHLLGRVAQERESLLRSTKGAGPLGLH